MARNDLTRPIGASLSVLTDGAGPSVVRVSACTRPCGESGGDFYDLLPFDEEHLGVFIGDVSGHGPHVGAIGEITRDLMRQQARRFGAGAPASMLISLNQSLFSHLPRNIFVTAIFGILHRPSGAFRMVRAGHSRPFLVRDGEVREIDTDGIALGLDNGELFRESLETERIVFREGTRLFLYTDGLVEAEDPSGGEFGLDRLRASLQTHDAVLGEEAFLAGVLGDWRAHLSGLGPGDDVTVIGLHRAL